MSFAHIQYKPSSGARLQVAVVVTAAVAVVEEWLVAAAAASTAVAALPLVGSVAVASVVQAPVVGERVGEAAAVDAEAWSAEAEGAETAEPWPVLALAEMAPRGNRAGDAVIAGGWDMGKSWGRVPGLLRPG